MENASAPSVLSLPDRTVKTKTGNVKEGRLAPFIFHDNRGKGSYYIGRNQYKRDLKELKNKKG